jgi:hypothetical protein
MRGTRDYLDVQVLGYRWNCIESGQRAHLPGWRRNRVCSGAVQTNDHLEYDAIAGVWRRSTEHEGDQMCWSTNEIDSTGAEWRGTNESRFRRSTRRRHRRHSGDRIGVIAHFVCVTWVTQPTHWVDSHWPSILVGWLKKLITQCFIF